MFHVDAQQSNFVINQFKLFIYILKNKKCTMFRNFGRFQIIMWNSLVQFTQECGNTEVGFNLEKSDIAAHLALLCK